MSVETMTSTMQFQDQLAGEAIQAKKDNDLIPSGRYRATLKTATIGPDTREFFDNEETKRNPFFNKYRWKCQMDLGSKRTGDDIKTNKTAPFETLDRPRVYFLDLCSNPVSWDGGGFVQDYVLYGALAEIVAKQTGSVPTDKQVYDWLSTHAVELHIVQAEAGVSKKTGKAYDAKNRVVSIKAIGENGHA